MKILNHTRFVNIILTLFFLILLLASPAFSKVITQFVPALSISGEYTDNYNNTENDKDDEYSTIYGADFSVGIIAQKGNLFLTYAPEYTDHNEFSENDSWRHDASLEGFYQAGKNTRLTFSESFVRDLNQSVRSNNFEKHDTNTTSLGINHQFGQRDSFGINYTYSFDIYDEANLDEFKRHSPSVFFGYWFSPKWGFDTNLSYSNTKYDIAVNNPETWSGDIRLLHMINRHLDIYAKYAQSFTDQASGDYGVYHPSVGFDWRPTDDSGITLGIGVLFQNWEIPGESNKERFFLDLDMYKNFDLTRKSRLSITGTSGYGDIDPEAASLGFNIYGQAGFLYTYQLLKKLSSDIRGSYRVNQYEEPGVADRTDNTLDLGAGLVWTPLNWLSIDLSYSFIDFNTDAARRDDYQENIGSLSIRLTPPQPVRFTDTNPRRSLENQVFTPR
jgi:opacity protein-like surface antigen